MEQLSNELKFKLLLKHAYEIEPNAFNRSNLFSVRIKFLHQVINLVWFFELIIY